MAFAALLFAPEVLTASKRCWVLDHHGDVEGEEGGGRKSCRYGMVWNGMEASQTGCSTVGLETPALYAFNYQSLSPHE